MKLPNIPTPRPSLSFVIGHMYFWEYAFTFLKDVKLYWCTGVLKSCSGCWLVIRTRQTELPQMYCGSLCVPLSDFNSSPHRDVFEFICVIIESIFRSCRRPAQIHIHIVLGRVLVTTDLYNQGGSCKVSTTNRATLYTVQGNMVEIHLICPFRPHVWRDLRFLAVTPT